MLSSYRVIKNQNVSSDSGTSLIETKVNLTPIIEETKPIEEDLSDDLVSYKEIRKELMVEIDIEKRKILDLAKKEAEVIKTEAKKKGYSEGYEIGYNEGIIKAREEGESIKARALKLIDEAEKYVEGFYKENKKNIIELAGQIAEEIVHHTIDTSSEDILMLINPILDNYGTGDSIVITCNPRKIPVLKSKLSKWEKEWEGTRFVILEDENLEKNGCTIENQNQFIDLQVKKQIESMIEEINKVE